MKKKIIMLVALLLFVSFPNFLYLVSKKISFRVIMQPSMETSLILLETIDATKNGNNALVLSLNLL